MVPVLDYEKDTRKRSRLQRYGRLSTSGDGGGAYLKGTFNVVIDFHTTDALPIVCNDAIEP